MSDMEKILTVEEVAEALRIKPFTVRQMFRENRLSGFKIGKAWRITEEALKADVDRMKSGLGGPGPRTALAAPLEAPSELAPLEKMETEEEWGEVEAGEEREEVVRFHPSPASEVGADTGSLVVFSEDPGQEVLLDGVRKGITTLSLIAVSVGEHRLEVGGASAIITIHKDLQLKVHRKDKRLEALSPPQTISLKGNMSESGDGAQESFRLRIHLSNATDYAGEFQIHLTAGDTRSSEEMFAENPDLLGDSGLSLRVAISAKDQTTVFDGLIKARADDGLEVSVPDQPACGAYGPWACTVGPDMNIELSLVKAGLLRTKNVLRLWTA